MLAIEAAPSAILNLTGSVESLGIVAQILSVAERESGAPDEDKVKFILMTQPADVNKFVAQKYDTNSEHMVTFAFFIHSVASS